MATLCLQAARRHAQQRTQHLVFHTDEIPPNGRGTLRPLGKLLRRSMFRRKLYTTFNFPFGST